MHAYRKCTYLRNVTACSLSLRLSSWAVSEVLVYSFSGENMCACRVLEAVTFGPLYI